MATLYEMTAAAAQLYEMLLNEDIDEQTLNDRENCFYYAFIVKEVTNNVSAAEPV